MEQELFTQYVEMINRLEEISKEGNSIHLSESEEDIAREIKEIANKDPQYKELLKKIHSLSPSERKAAINKHFSTGTEKSGKGTNEIEMIAHTFGVKVDKIRHYYLTSGVELFSFYSDELQREIVLENKEKGKSLEEYLREIQNQNTQFQTSDDVTNTNSILMNERNKKDIELGFLTKEELESQKASLGNLSEDEKRKLDYLIHNYDRLNIKGINVENMVFIDEEDSVHEAIIDSDQKVAVANPTELNSKDITKTDEEPVMIESEDINEPVQSVDTPDDSQEEMFEGEIEETQSFDELPANTRAQIIFYYNNPEELEKIEEEDEKNKWQRYISIYKNELEKQKNRPKIFIKNNISGYVDSALYISVSIGAVLLVAIIISLFYYYLY